MKALFRSLSFASYVLVTKRWHCIPFVVFSKGIWSCSEFLSPNWHCWKAAAISDTLTYLYALALPFQNWRWSFLLVTSYIIKQVGHLQLNRASIWWLCCDYSGFQVIMSCIFKGWCLYNSFEKTDLSLRGKVEKARGKIPEENLLRPFCMAVWILAPQKRGEPVPWVHDTQFYLHILVKSQQGIYAEPLRFFYQTGMHEWVSYMQYRKQREGNGLSEILVEDLSNEK